MQDQTKNINYNNGASIRVIYETSL